MAKKSVPVPPPKADKNKIVVPRPKRGVRDHVVNRHGGHFADRRKVASKRRCRGRVGALND